MKDRRTLYTDSRIANARRNVANYEWAKQLRDEAAAAADRYVSMGWDRLWSLVLPQTLPRSLAVQYELGSPISGLDFLRTFGMYGWELDPDGHRWKIRDPGNGYVFPTNDFGAFYRSGLDEQGIFRRERADERYLTNDLYPERGRDWGVDDGRGWIDGDGNKWTFIAYYAHWTYLRTVEPAVRALRDAFLLTGEDRYAHAGIILLDRLADLYPTYDLSAWRWDDGYVNSHGHTGQGKFVGSIWEAEPTKTWVSAFDALFPAAHAPEIVSFLSEKARRLGLDNPKADGEQICRNIEERLLRGILPAVMSAKIRGNHGMHESALAMTAVVLDEPGTDECPGVSRRIIDFLLRPGGLERDPWRITGCDLWGTLVNKVDRDGMGNEASPAYNHLWTTGLKSVADLLQGYAPFAELDLYKNPKFKKLLTTPAQLIMLGKYIPNIGDKGGVAEVGIHLRVDDYVKAYETYGDPEFARIAHFLAGRKKEPIRGDVFSEAPESIVDEIRGIVERHGAWAPQSMNLTGYGFAALRDGDEVGGESDRGVWLYYGRNGTSHAHADQLNVDLYAFGLDLAPDLGYPERATTYPKRSDWIAHTVSHNTVMVDRRKQEPNWVGVPHHFDGAGRVKLVDVEAPHAYPHVDLYRRTVALIRVDDVNSYAVDLFRVRGGTDHHFSFHGSEATVSTEGLNLVAQGGGTYLSPNGTWGEKTDDSGLQWLRSPAFDRRPPGKFHVDWKIRDFRGAAPPGQDLHLRLTMLGELDSVALADGEPPRKAGNPEALTYLIAHRSGDRLESTFTSVIEPYRTRPIIRSVERAPVEAVDGLSAGVDQGSCADVVALKIVLECGRTDYVVCSLDVDRTYTIDGTFCFRGFFGVLSETGGTSSYVYVHDGTLLRPTDPADPDSELMSHRSDFGALVGCVESFTKGLSLENRIDVRFDAPPERLPELVGKHLYIAAGPGENAAFLIQGATPGPHGRCTLDIGDTTLVKGLGDRDGPASTYHYVIAEGSTFRIPLSWELTR